MVTNEENAANPEGTTPYELKWVLVAYPILEDLLGLEDAVAPDSERGRVQRRIRAGHAYMLCNLRVVAIVRILRGIVMCRPSKARLKSILNASREWERDLERDIARMAELGERLRIQRPEAFNNLLNALPTYVKDARKGIITPDVFYDFISASSPELLRTVFDELEQADESGRPEGESPPQYIGELIVEGREKLVGKLTKEQILDRYVIPELERKKSVSVLAKRALMLIHENRLELNRPISEILYRWEKSYKDRHSQGEAPMP